MPVLCRLVLICRIPYEIINKYRFYGRMISAPTQITERAQFSQRSITRNYEPSSRTARNCAEQGVGFCGQRSALCVRDCRTHGSHNAAMCDFSAVHTKRQPIAEFCAKQGVGFCTRGSARGCVTEFAWFPQRSITRNYALAPKLRTGEPIAEFWVRQGVRFCTRGSVRRCVTERAWFSQRSITRNYALAILERLSLSIAIFSFSFLAASR